MKILKKTLSERLKIIYKEKLIKSYKYLYENAYYILAPFIYQETPNLIVLKSLNSNINLMLEEVLLSGIPIEHTTLYKWLEQKKKDKNYLEQVTKGLNLLKASLLTSKIELDIYELLILTEKFIKNQTNSSRVISLKLKALNEYFKINAYKNNDDIWNSGYKSTMYNRINHLPLYSLDSIFQMPKVGIALNHFIKFLSDKRNKQPENGEILTEKEKQAIYLTYHDELPWDLELICSNNEENNNILSENYNSCGKNFRIEEDKIYLNNKTNKYYQVCPYCGFSVNIPDELLTSAVKKRIEERNNLEEELASSTKKLTKRKGV